MGPSLQDVRSCVEQLQTIEREMRALDSAQKELGDLRDTLDRKKGERSELIMRREVRSLTCYIDIVPFRS